MAAFHRPRVAPLPATTTHNLHTELQQCRHRESRIIFTATASSSSSRTTMETSAHHHHRFPRTRTPPWAHSHQPSSTSISTTPSRLAGHHNNHPLRSRNCSTPPQHHRSHVPRSSSHRARRSCRHCRQPRRHEGGRRVWEWNPNSGERICTATCQHLIGQSNWSTLVNWSKSAVNSGQNCKYG